MDDLVASCLVLFFLYAFDVIDERSMKAHSFFAVTFTVFLSHKAH